MPGDDIEGWGHIVYRRLGNLIPLLGLAAGLGVGIAPTAAADGNYSGGATLCSSTGEVRGGSAPPPSSYNPYDCNYGDPLCQYGYDGWDPQIYLDIDRPGGPGGIGGPGRPGGPRIASPGGGGGGRR